MQLECGNSAFRNILPLNKIKINLLFFCNIFLIWHKWVFGYIDSYFFREISCIFLPFFTLSIKGSFAVKKNILITILLLLFCEKNKFYVWILKRVFKIKLRFFLRKRQSDQYNFCVFNIIRHSPVNKYCFDIISEVICVWMIIVLYGNNALCSIYTLTSMGV